MGQTFKALLVSDGTPKYMPMRTSGYGAHHTRELIGGTFCTCFHVRVGGDRMLVGMCLDDFREAKDQSINVRLGGDIYGVAGYPIMGPIVISACDGPDTVDMTDAEITGFYVVGDTLHYKHGGV